MANFPIITTQRSLPGTSGGIRANIDFDIGEEELFQQIGRLVGTVGDIGLKLHIQQAEIQLQEATLKVDDEMNNLSDRLRENQDENTYDAELAQSLQTVNQFRPQNGLAAREFDSLITRRTPGWKDSINKAKEIRLNNKFDAMTDTLVEKSVRNRTTAELRKHLISGLVLGRLDEQESGKILRDTINEMEYTAGLEFALTNPEQLLESIDDGKIEGFETLTEGQVIALRANAVGTINFNKSRERERLSANFDAMARSAIKDDITPSDMWAQIQQIPNATATEQIALYKRFMDSRKALAEGRGNPFTTTQNYPLYNKMYEDALDRTLTEEEIRAVVGKDDGISMIHGQKLRDIITDKTNKNQSREELTGFKDIEKIIDAADPFDEVAGKKSTEAAQRAARIALEDELNEAIKAGKPLTGRALDSTVTRIGRQFRKQVEAGLTPDEILPVIPTIDPEDISMGVFVGLQEIWDELTNEERRTAVGALAAGKTQKEIIDFFRRNE